MWRSKWDKYVFDVKNSKKSRPIKLEKYLGILKKISLLKQVNLCCYVKSAAHNFVNRFFQCICWMHQLSNPQYFRFLIFGTDLNLIPLHAYAIWFWPTKKCLVSKKFFADWYLWFFKVTRFFDTLQTYNYIPFQWKFYV